MDSASPIAAGNAGQTSVDSGRCFTFIAMGNTLAGKSAANERWSWASTGAVTGAYRGLHHPSATGYGRPG